MQAVQLLAHEHKDEVIPDPSYSCQKSFGHGAFQGPALAAVLGVVGGSQVPQGGHSGSCLARWQAPTVEGVGHMPHKVDALHGLGQLGRNGAWWWPARCSAGWVPAFKAGQQGPLQVRCGFSELEFGAGAGEAGAMQACGQRPQAQEPQHVMG